jgi:uncharacterized coiled-coil protein SlyX
MSLASRSPSPGVLPPWRDLFSLPSPQAAPPAPSSQFLQASFEEPTSDKNEGEQNVACGEVEASAKELSETAPPPSLGENKAANGEKEDVIEVKDTTENDNKDGPSLGQITDDICKLKASRRRLRSRLALNVNSMTDRMDNLEDRISDSADDFARIEDRLVEVAQLSATVDDQVNEIVNTTLSSLNAKMEVLSEEVKTIVTKISSEEQARPEEDPKSSEEMQAGVKVINRLVAEMRLLYESTQKQMNAEVEAVKAARIAAQAAITSQMQSPSSSQKRKRTDEEEFDEEMARLKVELGSTMVCGNHLFPPEVVDHVQARPVKRPRVVMRVLAQTATAVTIGAIATWGALAFS